MGVRMMFRVKKVLASIGYKHELIVAKLSMALIIIFPILQY